MGFDDRRAVALPRLHVVVGGRDHAVDPTVPVVVGRGADVDVGVDHPAVSRHHAILEPTAAGWTLTDISRNGTFLDGRLIAELMVDRATAVHLGAPDGVCVDLVPDGSTTSAPPQSSAAAAQGRLSSVHLLRSAHITIGRLPDNDVVVDDLLVSRRHAEMRRTSAGWELTDLASGNGTFVNGRRICATPLAAGDVIGIGHGLLELLDDRLVAYVDAGDNAFQARDLTVTTGDGKVLLHSVGFALTGRSLLAVIGPSGAGKSTLLAALVGSRPADVGEVRYADRSVYDDYDELRHRIALVPQDDVLHTQLRVHEALSYAAQLRFPADTTERDRERRVDEVLDELGLTGQADQCITSLSGGQRKRTSVALELLTKPSLLFLDEPTSGLDPGKDRSVMHTLRALADDARTVVVVTHNVANLEVCDRLLVLATGGWVAYFGPPAEALAYFGEADYADIFLQLDTAPGEHWARRYRESPLHRRYVGSAQDQPPGSHHPPTVPTRAPRQQTSLTQLAVLGRRCLAVITSDRQYAIFLAVLPLVLSLLARAVPGSAGLSVSAAVAPGPADVDPQPLQLLLVLIIGAALMGAAVSVRELVKERPIYQRERAIGLGLGPYMISKVLVLGGIVGLQVTVFTGLSLLGRNGPDDPLTLPGALEILVAVLAVGLVTMLIGLAFSAVIDNADRGMPLLVLMVMVQLIFSGGLFAVHDRPVLEQLAWLAPARWAFAMTAATADLSMIRRGTPDPLWNHAASAWWACGLVLLGMAAALGAFTGHRLARLDPRRRPRRR